MSTNVVTAIGAQRVVGAITGHVALRPRCAVRGERAADTRSAEYAMNRAYSAAAALLETVARLALVVLVLFALLVRLLFVAVRAAGPSAAPDLHTAALGRLSNE
jgi:hypothetical protein